MPSNRPRAGVASAPLRTTKTLKARPLRHRSVGGRHQSDGGIAVIGLEDSHRQVEPVEVLDPLVERFRRDALGMRQDHAQALLPLGLVGNPDEGLREGIEAIAA
jgi:hypothetical protein